MRIKELCLFFLQKLMLLKPLEKLAREETNNLRQFTYALDVLLPEVTTILAG